MRELDVVTPGVEWPVGRMSGGNVQKVLVGREIASSPQVLMVAYPVRGWISIRRIPSTGCSMSRKRTVLPLSAWARTWMCCWPCATASWCWPTDM